MAQQQNQPAANQTAPDDTRKRIEEAKAQLQQLQDLEKQIAATKSRIAGLDTDLEKTVADKNGSMPIGAISTLVREIVEGLRAPSEDEKKILERRKREAEKLKRDQEQMLEQQRDFQANCPHIGDDEKTRINLISNFPDRIIRGICGLCQKMIEPDDVDYQSVRVKHQKEQSGSVS